MTALLGEPVQRLLRIAQQQERLIVGLMSGTSADGIDAALVRLHGCGEHAKIDLLAFACYPLPPEMRDRIFAVSRPGAGSVDEICRLNVAVGECFAAAALRIIAAINLKVEQVDLIGSHGQTVHHQPNAQPFAGVASRGTLQLGEPSVIAKRTGIITIADFRPADLALGGQGAPLVPLLDFVLFRSQEKTRGMLNLGGIANLTILKKGALPGEVIAYDTGPANMVIDALMRKLYARAYDDGGSIAATGKVSHELLLSLMAHPYFARPFPKSTGGEEFGEAFAAKVLSHGRELSPADIVATATALTAETVWQEAQRLQASLGKIGELIVSGGGRHNHTLMRLLQQRFSPAPVLSTDQFGVSGDAKEAMLMALLANETVSGNAGNLPSVTGAAQAGVLGKICM